MSLLDIANKPDGASLSKLIVKLTDESATIAREELKLAGIEVLDEAMKRGSRLQSLALGLFLIATAVLLVLFAAQAGIRALLTGYLELSPLAADAVSALLLGIVTMLWGARVLAGSRQPPRAEPHTREEPL